MAHFLRGYDYEPEYTAEEVETRSKAAVSVCVPGEPVSDIASWCQRAFCRLTLQMDGTDESEKIRLEQEWSVLKLCSKYDVHNIHTWR